jgi:hypothetical protein
VAAHQALGHRLLHRLVEELLQHARLIEAAAAILAEGRGVPSILVEVKAYEPAQRHVALQLHHQLALARNSQQVSAQQGQEQLLGRNRRATQIRVQRTAHPPDRPVVDQRPDPAQRMLRRHEALERELVEQSPLRIRLAHHRLVPPSREF